MQCKYRGHHTAGERCTRAARPGWTTCASHYSAGRARQKRDCRVCGGDGYLASLPEGKSTCPACGGSGQEEH